MRKIKLAIGAIVFSALLAQPHYKASAANCDFSGSLNDLSKAQAASALNDSKDNIMAELEIRKGILKQTLDCSADEASNLESEIKSVDTGYPTLPDIQTNLVSKLNDVLNYYQAQKNSVGDLGVEGSKIFSSNLKIWRASNYAPLADLGKNFVIFAQNQYILQTAQNRLSQINIALKTLNLSDNQAIGGDMDQAKKNLSMANSDNDEMKNEFRAMAWPNNIGDLLDSSLNHMKDAYQNFFDVSTEVQKLISASK